MAKHPSLCERLEEKLEEQDIAFTHSIVCIERDLDTLRQKTATQLKQQSTAISDLHLAISDIRHRLDTIEIKSRLDVLNDPPKKNPRKALFCKVVCIWIVLSLVLFLSWILYDIHTSPLYPIVIPYYINHKYVMY
jgi:hypothetical protein